jgi:hypothetical protein
MRRFGILLVGCALVVAGCTSSGGSDSSARLRSVLLQLKDFPPSWRAFPQPEDAPDLLGDIAVCTGAVEREDPVSLVRSSEFRHGDQRISSTAVELKTTSDVSKRSTSLGRHGVESCAAQAGRRRVLDAVPDATIISQTATVQEGGVNVAINFAGEMHGVYTVDSEGRRSKVYVDAVFILGTAFYSDITFVGVDHPVPATIQHVLTDNVALREQHA